MKPNDNDSLVRFSKPPQRTIAPAGNGSRRSQEPRDAGRAPEPIRVRREGVETVARPRSRMADTEPIAAPRPAPSGNYSAPQEPYSWGEYLRRSYPVIGIILLLGAFWVWSARQLSTAPPPSPTAVLVAPTAAVGTVAVITPTAPRGHWPSGFYLAGGPARGDRTGCAGDHPDAGRGGREYPRDADHVG